MKMFRTSISYEGYTAEQMLMLVMISLNDLYWNHCCTDEKTIYARCNLHLFSRGEQVQVKLKENEVLLSCIQPSLKIIASNRCQTNIEKLVEYIGYNRQIYTAEQLDETYLSWKAERKDGLSPTEKIVMSNSAPPATIGLIIVCTLAFFYSISYAVLHREPLAMGLFQLGANIRLYTLGDEGWRLFTSCFLHMNLFHLAGNMLVLYFIGRYLEPVVGWYPLLLLFICTGALGSLTSVIVAGNRMSVGASGAIFGLYGVFIALLTTKLITGEIKRTLFQGIVLISVYGLYGGMAQGIDNAAHIGGLISGILLGYLLYTGLQKRAVYVYSVTGAVMITAGIVVAGLYFFHNDSIRYERMLKRLRVYEGTALSARTDLSLKTTSQQLKGLTDTAGPQWRLFINTLDSAQHFRFGKNKRYAVQRDLLKRYGQCRLAENEIWIQALRSGKPMEGAKDSIRLLTMDKYDSLQNLRLY